MKIVLWEKYGSPDVLRLTETDQPIPKDNEVLIKVMASTVNRTDCAMLRAKPFIARLITGLIKPNRPATGTEFAGVIFSVGKDVKSFKAGDKVFGFEDMVIGTHAEFMVLTEDRAISKIPEEINYLQAAACLEGAHYAYNMINKVTIKPGQRVLVNGAAGGIGSASVQLLKHFGAIITGVCETKNMDLVKSLGAAEVIDYSIEDFTKLGNKYDFILDAAGKSSFGKCKPLLNNNGAYISSELGKRGENLYYSLTTPLSSKIPGQHGKQVKFPLPSNIKTSIQLVKDLIENGEFKAVIDRTYPLDQIVDAFKYVEKGFKTGNVVIEVGFVKSF